MANRMTDDGDLYTMALDNLWDCADDAIFRAPDDATAQRLETIRRAIMAELTLWEDAK